MCELRPVQCLMLFESDVTDAGMVAVGRLKGLQACFYTAVTDILLATA